MPGVEGRLCLFQNDSMLFCSLTPNYSFRVRLHADGPASACPLTTRLNLSIHLKGGMFADVLYRRDWHWHMPRAVMQERALLPEDAVVGSLAEDGSIITVNMHVSCAETKQT